MLTKWEGRDFKIMKALFVAHRRKLLKMPEEGDSGAVIEPSGT